MVWGIITAALALIGGAVYLFVQGKKSGANNQKVKVMEKEKEVRDEGRKIDHRVRSDSDYRKRVRDYFK